MKPIHFSKTVSTKPEKSSQLHRSVSDTDSNHIDDDNVGDHCLHFFSDFKSAFLAISRFDETACF